MRTIYILIVLGMTVLTGCSDSDGQKQNENDQVKETDLKKVLEGTWQTYQLNIAVNSADGLDSFRAEYLNQEIWEKEYNIQPPIYYFQADQNYRLVRLSLAGDVISESLGTWDTNGDTLIIVEPEISYKYVVKHGNGRAGFRTIMDWDGDGQADDEYQSIQRKISIGTN